MAKWTTGLSGSGKNAGVPPPIALGGEIVNEPGLPHPWVAYPGHYGVFHAFADTRYGHWRLCTCARPAVATVAYIIRQDPSQYSREITDRMGLPVGNLPAPNPWEYVDVDDGSVWADRACHRCNLATPSLRWAHEMYETQFNQFHGWYTAQAMARAGFMKSQRAYAPSAAPELVELRLKAEPIWSDHRPEGAELGPGQTFEQWRYQHQRELKSDPAAGRAWNRIFQDEARVEFGYRKVGEGNVAEFQLASLIAQILGPNTIIDRHHRPKWLEGLELDIWLPGFELGLEYQGQQHYKAIEAWGGAKALHELQIRDARKKELCAKRGVGLIEVVYTEPLTRTHVGARLSQYIPTQHLPVDIG